MKAVYALYEDGHAAQQAVNRLRAAGLKDPRHHGAVGPADGGVRVRPHGQGQLDVVDRLRRRAWSAWPRPTGWPG